MKTTFVKIALMLCILSLIASGCKKDTNNSWVITPEKPIVMFDADTGDLSFKFCLLNQWEDAATVFKEGTNLTFSLSISNNSGDTITIPTEFINSEFYRVYQKQDNTDMGKPWTGIWCEKSFAPHIITLPPAKTKQLDCPWFLTYFEKPDYPLCITKSKDPLPKGEYFTKLNLNLQYIKRGETKQINYLTFKIDFEIQ
ncbi:hypothetical protein PbJCM13498_31690 [Prolixibacter bellariivorans]|uniref:Lipoprotein n=3 Tax=Prolixibacter bellariivorans TaxID=314319 RepID=A0A5M4B362_9BACT|nr:hypothetical protein [Prolixibacter bellariivorans]GET34306.1 hypothetical protein PbJCM13498_31690 [Prolixibacter bellariivorans]